MIVSGFGCSKSVACYALDKSLSCVRMLSKAIEFPSSLWFVQWIQPSTLYLSKETVESGWARLKRNPRDIEGSQWRFDHVLSCHFEIRGLFYTSRYLFYAMDKCLFYSRGCLFYTIDKCYPTQLLTTEAFSILVSILFFVAGGWKIQTRRKELRSQRWRYHLFQVQRRCGFNRQEEG